MITNPAFRALFLTAIFSISAFAQTPRELRQIDANLRKHVAYLTSDALAGRKAGESGSVAAAGYVANHFAQLKLRPGKGRTTGKPNFLQQFPFIAGITPGDENALRLVPQNFSDERKMELRHNWVPLGSSPNIELRSVELVFAGYGIIDPAQDHDDYENLDVEGKVVLILSGTPDGGKSPAAYTRFNPHTKIKIAADKGAVAVLFIAAKNILSEDPLAQIAYDRELGNTKISAALISRQTGAELIGAKDPTEMTEIMKWLEKRKETPAGIWIGLTSPPTVKVNLKIDLTKEMADTYNVIAVLEGRDAKLKDEAIIIGAHYDHLGRNENGMINPGADDNASGVAAMLELARQLNREKKNKRSIIFVAFGANEFGRLGSRHYVENPVWPLNKTIAMINVDSVGKLSGNSLNINGSETATAWNNILHNINKIPSAAAPIENKGDSATAAQLAGTSFDLILNPNLADSSDHRPFYVKNIPILSFSTGTHTDMHTPADTANKINFEGLQKITAFLLSITQAIDTNENRPTFIAVQSAKIP